MRNACGIIFTFGLIFLLPVIIYKMKNMACSQKSGEILLSFNCNLICHVQVSRTVLFFMLQRLYGGCWSSEYWYKNVDVTLHYNVCVENNTVQRMVISCMLVLWLNSCKNLNWLLSSLFVSVDVCKVFASWETSCAMHYSSFLECSFNYKLFTHQC